MPKKKIGFVIIYEDGYFEDRRYTIIQRYFKFFKIIIPLMPTTILGR